MTHEQIKHLIDLSDRITNSHVIGNGSGLVVVFAAEFYALEAAIEQLQRNGVDHE